LSTWARRCGSGWGWSLALDSSSRLEQGHGQEPVLDHEEDDWDIPRTSDLRYHNCGNRWADHCFRIHHVVSGDDVEQHERLLHEEQVSDRVDVPFSLVRHEHGEN
jgi:hypothetical protein